MMDDGVDPERRDPSSLAWVRGAVALLLVAAAVALAVELLPSWYRLFGPYLLVDATLVVGALHAVAPFLLLAAVLVGAGRWPPGRRRLRWGVAALSVPATIDLVRDVYFAVLNAGGDPIVGPGEMVLVALFIVGAAGAALGFGLVAAGLWSDGAASDQQGRPTVVALNVLIGTVAIVMVAATGWVTAQVSPGEVWPALVTLAGILLGVGYGMLGVVAIAALRAMPRGGALPDVLIASGAVLAMIGGAGVWALPYAALGVGPDFPIWTFTLVAAMSAVGLLVMAAGFALGGRVDAPAAAALEAT